MVSMTAFMIWQGIGIAPDRYAMVLLLGSLLIKRTRSFLLDWIPFLFILIAYDFLRSLVPYLNGRVHFVELINADKFIFGVLPSSYLQSLFYHPGSLSMLDYLSTLIYFLHFALPLGFGFILWMTNKGHFRQFVLGILLLSYGGWITFVTYPAAPPWMAAQQGLIKVTKILDQTLGIFPDKYNLPTIYHNFNPNPVAAIPSMHSAYPVLIFLFAFSFFRKKAIWFFLYILAVFFSLVYLGEHYFIDELVGAIYAIIFFIVAKIASSHVKFLHG